MVSERILVFDLGGVIVSFDHMTICKRFSDLSAYSPEEIYKLIFTDGLEKNFDEGRISCYGFYKQITDLFKIKISYEQFIPLWVDIFHEIPEVINLINDLKKKNYTIYLLSNTNELHFGHCYKTYPVLEQFDKFILSFSVGVSKPHPRIYKNASEISGLPPERHIFIDDKIENVIGAQNTRMKGIQYQSIEQLKRDLELFGIII